MVTGHSPSGGRTRLGVVLEHRGDEAVLNHKVLEAASAASAAAGKWAERDVRLILQRRPDIPVTQPMLLRVHDTKTRNLLLEKYWKNKDDSEGDEERDALEPSTERAIIYQCYEESLPGERLLRSTSPAPKRQLVPLNLLGSRRPTTLLTN